ncbi:MAG: GrpB family protein [Pirellulaceae bacterium]
MSIRLMSHNHQWGQEFLQSRSMLFYATDGWLNEVRHIGGTALPEMVTQPVIDMLAGMEDIRGLNAAAELIEGLNYQRTPSPEWCQNELVAMLQKPRVGEPTHTVLIARKDGPVWQHCLAVQEFLGKNLAERQRFENLKRDHFQPGCAAEQEYAIAKSRYFHELAQRI